MAQAGQDTTLRDKTCDRVKQSFSAFQKGLTNDPHAAPAEFVIIGLAHWFVGILAWWIENGMTYTPQQMTLWIARFAMYGYPAVLGLNIPQTIGGVAPSDRLTKQS